MEEAVRSLVEAEWESRLGLARAVLRSGGLHVVVADLGANDAMSFLLGETCVIVVRPEDVEAARITLDGLDSRSAFSADALRAVVGADARVDGPSRHGYCNARSFRGTTDAAAEPVARDDGSLLAFLEGNSLAERAESGFLRDPGSANPETTRFWILRERDRVVAAGNMTEWRGVPADVGVLTDPPERGRGFAGRLVGTMVANALRSGGVGVVRYRALASNVASLAVAGRLGFEQFGENFRARRPR